MDLARLTVPTIAKNLVTLLGGDSLGVGKTTVAKIGESRSLFDNATFFLAKLILLAVGGVPNVINTKVGNSHENVEPGGPCIIGWIMSCNVQRTVAVRQGYSSHVPEYQHETEFLIIHIPNQVRHFVGDGSSFKLTMW
jgi:hypothetical protein